MPRQQLLGEAGPEWATTGQRTRSSVAWGEVAHTYAEGGAEDLDDDYFLRLPEFMYHYLGWRCAL